MSVVPVVKLRLRCHELSIAHDLSCGNRRSSAAEEYLTGSISGYVFHVDAPASLAR